jgi:Na+-driven multidrug efflux pump
MNTKLLMTISALTMGGTGIILSFLPHELLNYLSSTTGTILDSLILQILGALYFAFAMVNWTTKANLIGGIYSRPIAIGNLTHFTIGALALIKGYFSNHEMVILTLSIIYTVFAILFAIVFFRHPVKSKID